MNMEYWEQRARELAEKLGIPIQEIIGDNAPNWQDLTEERK